MTPTFTAVQIAQAMGRTSRGIRQALAGIKPGGVAIIHGKATATWSVGQLPESLQAPLAKIAQHCGYLDAESLLASGIIAWKPSVGGKQVSLAEVAPHCLEDARKLQQALYGALASVVAGCQPRSEIAASGLRDYQSVFGHKISQGHWWRLVEGTLKRDGGAGDFDGLEIFLSDKLARKKTQLSGQRDATLSLDTLQRWLHEVKEPGHPTRDETTMVWDAAFQEAETLAEAGMVWHRARRMLLNVLQKSGIVLAKSPLALSRNFDRKFARWIKDGGKPSAIADQRPEKSGYHRAPALAEEDRKTLIARAVENGGRIAQGWRTALRRDELSFGTTARFTQDSDSKSYVPHSIREAITSDVRLMNNINHGPRTARLKGAYVTRDYSDCAAADWYQGDDATLNHYYWEETPEGLTAMRGQCLLFVDVRTNYILGFALHSERNYTARVIRESILRIHDTYGLPRVGFYFERGIWKNARLITGGRHDSELPLTFMEEGLREFVRFRHAKTPRAKVVERIIGMIQNESEALPGYVGRNEITDRYERIQQKLAQARLGKIPYQSFLLSKVEWVRQLERIFERYNDEGQGGKLGGLSPHAAWEKLFNYANPLMKLPARLRYLLANHRKPMRVTRNGLRLTFKGQPHWFRNGETGGLIGRDVLVWFPTDEEVPESITITDMERKNPIEVPREIQPPSMTAKGETLREAIGQAEAHNAYARTLYRVIQPRFTRNGMFRHVFADEQAIGVGRHIDEARKEVSAQRNSQVAAWRGIRKHERARGLAPAALVRDPEMKLRGFENLRRASELESGKLEEGLHE